MNQDERDRIDAVVQEYLLDRRTPVPGEEEMHGEPTGVTRVKDALRRSRDRLREAGEKATELEAVVEERVNGRESGQVDD